MEGCALDGGVISARSCGETSSRLRNRGTERKEKEGARFSRKREEARTGATTEIEA